MQSLLKNLLSSLKSNASLVWSKEKSNPLFWILVVALVAFLGGLWIGWHHKVPEKVVEKTVEDTVTKQKLADALKQIETYQARIADEERAITSLKQEVEKRTRIIKHKDGSEVITIDEKKKTEKDTDTDKKHVDDSTNTKKTDETKTAETETTTHKETEKITTPLPKNWLFNVDGSTPVNKLELRWDVSIKHKAFSIFDADIYCGPGVGKHDVLEFKLGCAIAL